MLTVVLVVAFLLRIGFGLTQPIDSQGIARLLPDQGEYLQLATNLMDGRGLVLHDDRFDQDVYAYRTPGYPVFVAALGANVRLVRLAQALVDTSTVFAAYLIARKWLGSRASLVAAGLVAFNPFLIYFSGLILSETVYASLLTWGLYGLLDGRRRAWWTGLPLLLASVYVRPSAVGLTFLLAVGASWVNWRDRVTYHRSAMMLRTRVVYALFLALMATLATATALLPWMFRNYRQLGSPVWLTSNGGITAYDGFNPLQLNKPWRERGGSDQSFTRSMPELGGLSEIERDRYLKQTARDFIQDHPADLPELMAVKVLRTWSPIPLSADYGSRRTYVLAGLIYGGPFLLLALWGTMRPASHGGLRTDVKLVLLTPAIYFTVVHAMTVGSLRYRVPVEPLLAVLAASVVGKMKLENKVASVV